jgi:hypothetical protein
VTIVGALQFYLFQLRSCCPSPCCRSHLRTCVLQELLPSTGSCCRSHSRAGMLQELLPSAGSDGARVAARCCWSHPARGRPPLHELLPSAESGELLPGRILTRGRPPGAATLRQEWWHVGHDMQLPVASSRAPSGTATHLSRAATRDTLLPVAGAATVGSPAELPAAASSCGGCSPLGPSFLSPVLPIQRGFFHDSESKAVDMSPLLRFIGFLHERSSRRQAAAPRACPPEAHVKVGATGSTRLQRDTPDLEDDLGVRSFPPSGDFLVYSCIIPREDVVSQGRNCFLSFASLPSFIQDRNHN